VAHVREQRRLSREQENPEVRKGVGIANQSGPIGFFLESTTSSSTFLSPIDRARPQHLEETPEPPSSFFGSLHQDIIAVAKSTIIATDHREEYLSGYPSPIAIPGKLLRHPRNLVTVELFSSPILFTMGIQFLLVLLHNQGYPKVCPDSLNLSNAGDPFAGTLSLFFLFSVFLDQGLECFDLESSRVFSVWFPELSLFQINELLHFIDFRKEFIKVQNQLCSKP
jgi:hypothetical protein